MDGIGQTRYLRDLTVPSFNNDFITFLDAQFFCRIRMDLSCRVFSFFSERLQPPVSRAASFNFSAVDNDNSTLPLGVLKPVDRYF